MDEENFGYSLPVKEESKTGLLKIFQDDISSNKKYAFVTLLEVGIIHYLREKYAGGFPEPWDGVYFSATVLAEFYLVGSLLQSLYFWRDASKAVSELEKKIDS